jgi:hypothetical protein
VSAKKMKQSAQELSPENVNYETPLESRPGSRAKWPGAFRGVNKIKFQVARLPLPRRIMNRPPSRRPKRHSAAQKFKTASLSPWSTSDSPCQTPSPKLALAPTAVPSSETLQRTLKNTHRREDYAKLGLKQERATKSGTGHSCAAQHST